MTAANDRPSEHGLALDHVVVGASDVEATVAFFVALGLEPQGRSKVDAEVAAELYGLDAPTEQVVLGVGGVAIAGVRVVATPLAQVDRGDFFRGGHAVDFYTTDIARSVEVASATGATVGPVADYTFGPVHLTQAQAVGPDGVDVVFVGIDHRLPSALDAEPDRLHSEVHSVVASIDDLPAETTFWTEVAGLELKSRFPIDVPAVSEFMMLPRHAPVKMSVMVGPDAAPPRFELLAYDDADGRLTPSRPLTAGSIVPVFTSPDADGLTDRLVAGGASAGDAVDTPDGPTRWVRSPGGVDVLVTDNRFGRCWFGQCRFGRRRIEVGVSRPAYEAVAARLREQILGGELRPGDRLPTEPELSARYGVSRSTVREALRVLSSQNLVETTRGVSGGSFVVHPRAEHVRNYLEVTLGLLAVGEQVSAEALLEVRDLLEVPAAGLAARRATPEQLAAMRETLLDPRSAESAAMHECNHRFHALLVAAAGNPLLEVVAQPVYRTLVTRFARGEAELPFWEEIVDDHRLILAAVEEGEVERAQDLARQHLARLRSSYVEMDRAEREQPDQQPDAQQPDAQPAAAPR